MTDPLGLSVGVVNLVAVRGGQPPLTRRAVLTLFDQRPPEVGLPEQIPNLAGTGLLVGGFVERVGDPAAVLAADGSSHRGEELTADALDALARLTGHGAPVGIAVPAHWGKGPLEALQGAVHRRPGLNPRGVSPLVVSDATAAVAALDSEPGLPSAGVVALCDFGGSGTSITLFDAATNYRPVAPTVRYGALSGAQLDQAMVDHLLARLPAGGTGDSPGTAAVSSLTRLRDECRAAKERLSGQIETVVPVDLPGFRGDVRLTRGELADIIAAPLAGVADTISDMLSRNRIAVANLTAVAIVGGTVHLPMIGTQLAERLRVPVVTTSRPGAAAATGAALLAQRRSAPTGTIAAGPDQDSPTSLASAAWAAGAAGAAAAQSAADGDQSATFRALAWSQDDSKAYEPVPYAGADYSSGDFSGDLPGDFSGDLSDDIPTGHPAEPEPMPWYRRPVVLFGLAAALALAATGGLAYTLTGDSRTAHRSPEPPAPITVTVTAPNGETSLSTIPAPPPPDDTSTEPESSSDTTTAEPTSTTTTTTTTTTEQPTTTTTNQHTSTTTQTSSQPTSSTAAPTTTQPTQSAPPTASSTPVHPPTAPTTGGE